MNICCVSWVQDDAYGLCAVVIAATEAEALAELDLNDEYNSEIGVFLLGACTDGTEEARTVCRESL